MTPTVPTAADAQLHVFSTFLGIPPDTSEPPVCGAVLTAAYDFPGRERPKCPQCLAVLAAWQQKQKRARAGR